VRRRERFLEKKHPQKNAMDSNEFNFHRQANQYKGSLKIARAENRKEKSKYLRMVCSSVERSQLIKVI
jgi:hypothetical protein